MEPKIDRNFKDAINKWWGSLRMFLEETISGDKVPVIVALSRKMPRLLECLRLKEFTKNKLNNHDFEILEKCQVTTELALPFINCQNEGTNLEYFILDDIFIYGESLRKVYREIEVMTGSAPKVSAIFASESVTYPAGFEEEDLIGGTIVSQEEIDKYAELTSQIVEAHNLPIDMEFPIISLKFSNDQWERYLEYVENVFNENLLRHKLLQEEIEEDKPRLISLILNRGLSNNTNFAKIRFFKTDNTVKCETFAPETISEYDLLREDRDIFENRVYQNIWNRTTLKIRSQINSLIEQNVGRSDLIRSEIAQSLCVWYNYLVSVSVFVANKDELFNSFDIREFELDKISLGYLIGSKLAEEVASSIESLIRENEKVVALRVKVYDLPDSFGPHLFDVLIDQFKYMCVFEFSNLNKILGEIFRSIHYDNILFKSTEAQTMRMHFGETYDSLLNCLDIKFNKKDIFGDVHLWIDQAIDAGYVVPKYECQVNANGARYWRRYFHSGIRKNRKVS